MALRLQKEKKTVPRQLAVAIRLAFGRHPEQRELDALGAHYREMLQYHKGVEPARATYPTEILRSLVEEFSGDPFEYTERLTHYANYTYDRTGADSEASTRALADICLLLINSNEFIYVY
jgi:hypothetical protein